jgi:hypothetical protein
MYTPLLSSRYCGTSAARFRHLYSLVPFLPLCHNYPQMHPIVLSKTACYYPGASHPGSRRAVRNPVKFSPKGRVLPLHPRPLPGSWFEPDLYVTWVVFSQVSCKSSKVRAVRLRAGSGTHSSKASFSFKPLTFWSGGLNAYDYKIELEGVHFRHFQYNPE